jgi:hypothetical protein
MGWAETAAFGYLRERFEQRVREGPLAIPRHAPKLTASDGLAL